MAAITIKQFGGSIPRMATHLLTASQAAEAIDCKLHTGRLESWREPLQIRVAAAGTKTLAMFGCCWLDFEGCVDIAMGPPNCRKIFTTGDQDWPAVVTFDEETCVPAVHRLGVPCAYGAPSVTLGSLGTSAPKDTEGRSYGYQYVNDLGERGALSKTSITITARDGQTAVISGWEIPDASWGVVSVRIFRTVTGHQSGREAGNQFDTTWMLVGEALIGDASFVDTAYNDELQEALEEDIADPPPAEMLGITAISSMNGLAGFVGNRVYFSENNSYHQWPYYLDLDDNVCGMVESNGVLYVATDGHPYAIVAAVDCKNAGCRSAVRLPGAYPMAGCGNRRIVATPAGAVYPGHDGMIQLSGNGEPQNFAGPLYSPDEWHALVPQSLMPIAHGGFLFVFGVRGSFVVKIPGGSESAWPLDTHSEISDIDVVDAFVTRTGDLYLLKGQNVVQWDRGAQLRPHRWTSGEVVLGVPGTFTAANLYHKGGSESVTIRVDGRVVLNRPVLSAREFRLPNWANGSRWQFTLEGTGNVSLLSVATSMKELGA